MEKCDRCNKATKPEANWSGLCSACEEQALNTEAGIPAYPTRTFTPKEGNVHYVTLRRGRDLGKGGA